MHLALVGCWPQALSGSHRPTGQGLVFCSLGFEVPCQLSSVYLSEFAYITFMLKGSRYIQWKLEGKISLFHFIRRMPPPVVFWYVIITYSTLHHS